MTDARFFVIDGVDGCGKTTQARRLAQALAARGRPEPLHLREPGSTRLGERVRAILLDGECDPGAAVETLLFCAARRQTLDELVRPALAAGRDVVCERFHPSTFAYQAVAGELDPDRVEALLTTWAGDPRPDLTVLLAVDVDAAADRRAERARSAGDAEDRIEGHGIEFQRAVARGLALYAERTPDVVTVDGSGSEDEVAERVMGEVARAL